MPTIDETEPGVPPPALTVRGIPHEQVARMGFTALLDVLALENSYAVVGYVRIGGERQ